MDPISDLEALYTHYIACINKGPYFEPDIDKEETGKGPNWVESMIKKASPRTTKQSYSGS